MLRLTDVVRHLLIINVIMFFGTMLLSAPANVMSLIRTGGGEWTDMGRYMLAVFYPASPYFQPFQIVTHMFMHGGIAHLFFNMFALYMFGPPLEALFGPKRFLFFYFFTGLGALGLTFLVKYFELSGVTPGTEAYNVLINTPMLGASGAVFGILAGFGMKFPNTKLQLIFPPIAMKAKYFVLIYAGLELFLGFSGMQTGVAHFAHVGGALFGFLLILYWNKFGSRW